MKFDTNKAKGNSGLAAAIAYYSFKGYTVSIPLNDTQDYDLVIDDGANLYKVQVKATAQRTPEGYTAVNVCSSGGTNGSVYRRVRDTNVDLLFVFTELQEMYELPISAIHASAAIVLGPSKQKYRVDKVDTEYIHKLTTPKEIKALNYINCKRCGKLIDKKNESHMCLECFRKNQKEEGKPDKNVFINNLIENSFSDVSKMYNVSERTIRKWCKYFEIPSKRQDIIAQYKNQ